jgi:hypothetical protein
MKFLTYDYYIPKIYKTEYSQHYYTFHTTVYIIFVHFYKDLLHIPDLILKLNGFFANFYIVISLNAGNIQEYGKDI